MLMTFGDCVLDLNRRELRREDRVVATAPRVFDLLVHLLRNRDRVVNRDDLINVVWAGRVISDSTVASHINEARKAVGDDGRNQRVIRTIARKGFRFVAAVNETKPQVRERPSAIQPFFNIEPPESSAAHFTRPSIAVLPMMNLSGDADQDHVVEGVLGDIMAALSQHRWLYVVSCNSSAAYNPRLVDTKSLARELGVRYFLVSSWRKAGDRVRMTAQIIDAATGAYHWAGRFEGVLLDIFALQDQITTSVAGTIVPQLERVEIERAMCKSLEHLEAYDYYWQAMAQLHQGTRLALDQAMTLFQRAITADPTLTSAYAMLAWCYCWRKANRWLVDPTTEITEGIRLARQALTLDRGDAVILCRSGHALGFLAGDLPGGIALLDKALVLNPNLATAWFLGGVLRIWYGDTDSAIEYLCHAIRLSPMDLEQYRMHVGLGLAYFFKEQYETACVWIEKALNEFPDFCLALVVLIASRAHQGEVEAAHQSLVKLCELDSTLNLSNISQWLPIHQQKDLTILLDGLRMAGMTE